jgi:hypothetical protein
VFKRYKEKEGMAILEIILVYNLPNILRPKFTGQSVTLLFYIPDFPHSYLDAETEQSCMRYSVIFVSPS